LKPANRLYAPLDEESLRNGVWYPDEEICTSIKCGNKDWIRNQRKIKKRAANRNFYFTHEMLCRNCQIRRGIDGLDPDNTSFSDKKAEESWLKKHPEKRKWTEEEKYRLASPLKKRLKPDKVLKKYASNLYEDDFYSPGGTFIPPGSNTPTGGLKTDGI